MNSINVGRTLGALGTKAGAEGEEGPRWPQWAIVGLPKLWPMEEIMDIVGTNERAALT